MRKDAVVLEIRKKTAVVLAPDGRFLRVRNRNYQVGQRIPEAEQAPVRIRPLVRRTLVIAACLVLALGSSALAASKYMVWSYAGVDFGDISVNYTLNFRNEVLKAEGNSEEAEQLIDSMEKIPYEPVDSAVERMMDTAGENRPVTSENPEDTKVVVSVASFLGGTGRVEDRVMEGVDRSMEKTRPEDTPEQRREDVSVERLDWPDAGSYMENRRHPQNAPEPDTGGKTPELSPGNAETLEKNPEISPEPETGSSDWPTEAPQDLNGPQQNAEIPQAQSQAAPTGQEDASAVPAGQESYSMPTRQESKPAAPGGQEDSSAAPADLQKQQGSPAEPGEPAPSSADRSDENPPQEAPQPEANPDRQPETPDRNGTPAGQQPGAGSREQPDKPEGQAGP